MKYNKLITFGPDIYQIVYCKKNYQEPNGIMDDMEYMLYSNI